MREVASLICLINIRGGGRWMPAAITDDCLHPHKSGMDILKLYSIENHYGGLCCCLISVIIISKYYGSHGLSCMIAIW